MNALCALAPPLAITVVWAQPLFVTAPPAPRTPRWLLRPDAPADPHVDAFRPGLRELGYVEGQRISLEYRWAEGKPARPPARTAELVRLKVDVIVTHARLTMPPSIPGRADQMVR